MTTAKHEFASAAALDKFWYLRLVICGDCTYDGLERVGKTTEADHCGADRAGPMNYC